MTNCTASHLGVDLRRLPPTDSPPAVDDSEGNTSDTLPASLSRHGLDFFLVLVGVEELGGLWEMLRRHLSCA